MLEISSMSLASLQIISENMSDAAYFRKKKMLFYRTEGYIWSICHILSNQNELLGEICNYFEHDIS